LGEYYSRTPTEWPSQLIKLSIAGNSYQTNLINNLPNVQKLALYNLRINISNLPFTLKKIVLSNEDKTKFLDKIPFGCELVFTDKKDKKENIQNPAEII
jgi:hypothetical protein